MIMKSIKYTFLTFWAFILLALVSCSKVGEMTDDSYGYVQFKLYKEASYVPSKALETRLDYLHDVSKIRVTMRYGKNDITQTLVMNASNDEAAEYGMRSDKIKLLSGRYELAMFTLYDKNDQPLYQSTPSGDFASFEVVPGGLHIQHFCGNSMIQRQLKIFRNSRILLTPRLPRMGHIHLTTSNMSLLQ